MVLYFIGLGLGDETDITVKGLEAVKRSKRVYLENYTSILGISKEKLEKFYDRPLIVAYRETVEIEMDSILEEISKDLESDFSFLVVGDPFCATTHSDLFLRAHKLGITVRVIHNASIMNAIGATGLMLYRFGETVSIPFYQGDWRPYSFLDKIVKNYQNGFHTLVLLDIRVREISNKNLALGKDIYDAPHYMSCKVAVEQILEAEESLKTGIFTDKLKCVGVARMGFDDQKIASGNLTEFLDIDMGAPLHSFIVCAGDIHEIEMEMFDHFKNQK
jgi:diphthine synthase